MDNSLKSEVRETIKKVLKKNGKEPKAKDWPLLTLSLAGKLKPQTKGRGWKVHEKSWKDWRSLQCSRNKKFKVLFFLKLKRASFR